MSRIFKIAIIVIIVIGLSIWFFATDNNQSTGNPDESATTTTEQRVDLPAGWETYVSEEFDFTVAHPAAATVQTEGPENRHTKFTYLGGSNATGEITDGFTLTISSYPTTSTSANSLMDFARQRLTDNPTGDAQKGPTQTTWQGQPAVTYQTESIGLIDHTLVKSSDAYIVISESIADPSNSGYAEIVSDMKQSLTLTKNATSATLDR